MEPTEETRKRIDKNALEFCVGKFNKELAYQSFTDGALSESKHWQENVEYLLGLLKVALESAKHRGAEVDRLTKENKELREALKLYKEYVELLDLSNKGAIVLAWVHGWRCSDEDIKKGEEYRTKIQELLKVESKEI